MTAPAGTARTPRTRGAGATGTLLESRCGAAGRPWRRDEAANKGSKPDTSALGNLAKTAQGRDMRQHERALLVAALFVPTRAPMLLTTFIGKDPVTKNYDENVRKSAIAYKRRNGVELQQTDNLLVLSNRRDGKVLSWMDGTSYQPTSETDIVIITHGCPGGASILWPTVDDNGEPDNPEVSPTQLLAFLDAYTPGNQIRLRLIACGGALFAWTLMEEQHRRRLLAFEANEEYLIRDTGEKVTLVAKTGNMWTVTRTTQTPNEAEGAGDGEAASVSEATTVAEESIDESALVPRLAPAKLLEVEAWGGSASVNQDPFLNVQLQTDNPMWGQPAVLARPSNGNVAGLWNGGLHAIQSGLVQAGQAPPHPEAFKYIFYPTDGVGPGEYGGGRGFACRSVDPPGWVYNQDFISIQVFQGGTDQQAFDNWPNYQRTRGGVTLNAADFVGDDPTLERETDGVEQALRDLMQDLDRLQLMMRPKRARATRSR